MSNLENLGNISRVILSSQSPVPLLSGGVLIHSRSVEKPRGCPARMGKRKATGSFDVDVLYLASWNIGKDAMPDRAREDPTGEAGQGRADEASELGPGPVPDRCWCSMRLLQRLLLRPVLACLWRRIKRGRDIVCATQLPLLTRALFSRAKTRPSLLDSSNRPCIRDGCQVNGPNDPWAPSSPALGSNATPQHHFLVNSKLS